ncbi:hypothetical protein CDL12_14558 [Handroanthus impetiginosus]|uniref:KIB1-4 beta-propeller domain-containing protein n=1 Tax=Handroanthus impetiginosus TaxID=429701 RepID=A0A2G9H698_9LAMI|nr:hypothetical protein CDL12_14558 [Handroanthus impetiginosus]
MKKGCEYSPSCLPKDSDQTHPPLLVSQGKNSQGHTFYDISKNESIKRDIPEFCNKHVSATSYGWLTLIDYRKKPLDCCLFNPESNEMIQLPSIKPEREKYQCFLSKPPTHPDCYVLLFVSCRNFLHFCRLGDEKFIKRQIKLHTLTSFKEKIYARMSESGNFVEIDFVDQHLLLKEMVNDSGQILHIPWPSPSNAPWHAHDLVESCGELLLVHMIGYHHSAQVAYFRIFRINTVEREWEELSSIGDRTIFFSLFGSMSLSCTNRSYLKKNSIYYSWIDRNLWIYDIEDRSKTLIKSTTSRIGMTDSKSWIML